ncbi:MAG: flagellar basal body-associated FliL family protein [Pseudomonadota bacterium]
MVKIIILCVIAVVVIAGGVAAVFLTPLKDKIFGENHEKTEEHKAEESLVNLMEITYLALPDVLINLKATNSRPATLKASFVIELVKGKDKEAIDHMKPLIIDQFQTYLRELEVSDTEGAVGVERVRQELKNRISNLIAPLQIRQVLIKEFLIQ